MASLSAGKLLQKNNALRFFVLGRRGLSPLQLKLVRHAITITNGLGHFFKLGATSDLDPPRLASSLSFPPDPSPKESLVAIWVMKHSATGSHALGTCSTAATASTHPHPLHQASRHTATEGPRPAPLLSVGAPRAGPPSQLPRSHVRTEPGPSPAAPKP